ncbi:leukocyte elastase inhibitor isoform X1 [Microplitis demolitor]|uniref:leukocyte elastase inhibitor isoform X1 n=1 Tax=Microplitis demolitor TaxID=69319 RepID=UPI00235B5DD9|nr:leukocyte elastase inhibitor isoform X1 [Microplitis demolitor]
MNTQLIFCAVIMAMGVTKSCAACTQFDGPALKAVSNGANQFSTSFYKALADSESGNFICSPVSVNVVMSMVSFGAHGDTEQQLKSVLNLPCDKSIIKQGYQELIDSLNNVKGAELKLANKIFAPTDYELKPEFKELTKTFFRSEIQNVDFKKSEEAAKTINDWCASKTNNHITELFKADDVRDSTLVLVNAVYFKGKWADKFDSALTKPAPFYTDEKTTTDVQMMHKHGQFYWGFISEVNARFIELPYESKDFNEAISMFIILPNEINGLLNVESNLYKIDFGRLRGYKSSVDLYLPKFKIESKFDLKEILEKLGISEIFKNTANFSGISDKINMKVSKIVQKAFIEVNEEGSEAAAVTGILMGESARPALPPPPELFVVDKPFIYSIVDRNSDIILFQGHIYIPV